MKFRGNFFRESDVLVTSCHAIFIQKRLVVRLITDHLLLKRIAPKFVKMLQIEFSISWLSRCFKILDVWPQKFILFCKMAIKYNFPEFSKKRNICSITSYLQPTWKISNRYVNIWPPNGVIKLWNGMSQKFISHFFCFYRCRIPNPNTPLESWEKLNQKYLFWSKIVNFKIWPFWHFLPHLEAKW